MSMRLVISLIVCIMLFAVTASADVITIDGDDTDWKYPDTSNDDPNETGIADDYDVDWNYYEWDDSQEHCSFAFYTYDSLASDTQDNFGRVIINVDADSTTGGMVNQEPGMEYYIHWDLDRTNPSASLHYWTGSGWSQVTSPTYVAVDAGTNFIEWAVHADDIGYPSKFAWGGYLDNGGVGDDDFCPDDVDQPGFTPEPATVALFGLGLLGLGAWRRRRDAE